VDIKEKQLIDHVSTVLLHMLRGKKVEPIQYDKYPESMELLVKVVNEMVYSISEIWDFILPLSRGVLNIEPPKASNVLASPFKELHSQLRNLVWQVQQVAKGDYKQRVVFMGEFSSAFNSMVEALEEKERLIKENIQYLEDEAKRLRESEARYASAVKNSLGGIYIFDPLTLEVIESNQQFNTMMGYSKEEITKLTVYDFYADLLIAEEDLGNILRKSLHSISNRQYRTKNGGYIEVDIHSCWSISGQNNVVIVSVQDVTARNKAQEIAAKYKVLLENARDIILFVNFDGRIIEANKAAEDAYGYSREELLTLSIYDLHNENDRLVIDQYMKEAKLGGMTFEITNIRKDGSAFPVEVSSQSVLIGDQVILGQVIRDISDRKRIEENLLYLASHDFLTRIPNRRVLEEAYMENFVLVNQNKMGALLLIDVDNFKFINDTFGHSTGDMVLIDLVTILKENLGKEDLLARLGGDEFCVLLEGVTPNDAKGIAEKLRRAIEEAEIFPRENKIPLKCTISIGVAPFHNGALEFRYLISRADYALYQAKEEGRNRVCSISNEQLDANLLIETNNLMHLIKNALESEGIVLYFQPIMNIATGEIIHHEALMRIVTQTGEIIYPGKVIPIAERFGLMTQIDKRIMELSFEALEKYPNLKLFVNLSGASIGNEELLSFIEENLIIRGIEASRLGFEITETIAVKDFARADRWIRQLREMGCRFALDDFGIGFSSFSYLQYLSVDYVKIDGSYVHDLDKNYKNRALVQAMNTVARSLGKEVIAEFVENKSILNILEEDQISHAQGYYVGQPTPVPQSNIVLELAQSK